MILPTLKNGFTTKKIDVALKGINQKEDAKNCITDSLNLTFSSGCRVRNSRKPQMFLNFIPHQKIICGGKLFLRHYNTLYRISNDQNQAPVAIEKEFTLKNLPDNPDRILLDIEGDLCVLPDGLRFKEKSSSWIRIGSECSRGALFPFTDSRNLFYTLGYNGEETCDDSVLFSVGMEFRFSWLPFETFTVIRHEEVSSKGSDGSEILEGYNITLDRSVTGWNSIPSNGALEIREPDICSLTYPLHLGINRSVGFSGKHIYFSSQKGLKSYYTDLNKFIHIGQRVQISGSIHDYNNKSATITNIVGNIIYFDTDFKAGSAISGAEIILTPEIPEFDTATYFEGRVIGIENKCKTLWISAATHPFFFYREAAGKEDAIAFYYDEQVNAMTVFKGAVTCFFAAGGFRILGDNAFNFGKVQLSTTGIDTALKNSLCTVNDRLIYCSGRGIMEYSSGKDNLISSPLKEAPKIYEATAAGGKYFGLSDDYIYVYDPTTNRWWKEDAAKTDGIFSLFGKLYLISENVILTHSGENFSTNWELKSLIKEGNFKDFIPLKLFCKLNSSTVTDVAIFATYKSEGIPIKLDQKQMPGNIIFSLPMPRRKTDSLLITLKGRGCCEIENLTLSYRRI